MVQSSRRIPCRQQPHPSHVFDPSKRPSVHQPLRSVHVGKLWPTQSPRSHPLLSSSGSRWLGRNSLTGRRLMSRYPTVDRHLHCQLASRQVHVKIYCLVLCIFVSKGVVDLGVLVPRIWDVLVPPPTLHTAPAPISVTPEPEAVSTLLRGSASKVRPHKPTGHIPDSVIGSQCYVYSWHCRQPASIAYSHLQLAVGRLATIFAQKRH